MPAVAPPDLDADVCVVGGGIAGLLAALRLARRGLDVVLLERALIAPAPRTALLAAGVTLWLGEGDARLSKEAARSTFDLSLEAMAGALALFDELGVERRGRGLLRVGAAHEVAILDAEDAARELLGLVELRRWAGEEIAATIASTRYVGGTYEPHAVLYETSALSAALMAAALAAGVRILELTPAVAADLAGVRKYVMTPSGRVRADHVVLCAGRGLAPVAPWLAGALGFEHWVRGGFAVRAARPDFSGLVAEPGRLGARFVPSDGELMFEAPTASAVHGEVPAAVTLRRRARAVYPELGRALAEYAGGFSLARARHGLPLIGEHRPGVWYAAGLGANPLANAALAAEAITGAIVERNGKIAELAPFAPRYAFGAAGRVAATTGFWWLRLRDGVAHLAAARASREAPAEPASPRQTPQAPRERARGRTKRPEARPAHPTAHGLPVHGTPTHGTPMHGGSVHGAPAHAATAHPAVPRLGGPHSHGTGSPHPVHAESDATMEPAFDAAQGAVRNPPRH
ncbi:NAD(P)/FAD-dependent oxidoreductase [Azorhizobium doebereinerae]|uniref:NAD(P)/FAD-dependent oxidoreductase n=1 Tax=Azorhizobium doebereinerae TaxID=281091 RepID=UPI0004082E92|nr:FAD-binding oxidoreductase [Azorhizobium doebereinerae]